MPTLAMTEADWQTRVVDYARLRSWTVWHDNDSRRNRAGLPDLILVRDRVVWAELKGPAGRLRAAQKTFLAALGRAGAETYVWRPSDWPDVMAVLR